MDRIWLPLQGPTGVRPKAPAVGAWQSPGYDGIDPDKVRRTTGYNPDAEWIGMRCDGLVVVDCDSKVAAKHWCIIDPEAPSGWVRMSPRGVHFLYEQTPGSPDAPAAGVWPEIDVRAGRTSQIVVYAPGYHELHGEKFIRPFNPAWLPEGFGVQQDRSNDESWDEMPHGRGNNTMAAFAGAFRKQGMSPVTIAKCLGAINKITMTDDPMPIDMIVEITKSVGRYAARPDIDIEIEE